MLSVKGGLVIASIIETLPKSMLIGNSSERTSFSSLPTNLPLAIVATTLIVGAVSLLAIVNLPVSSILVWVLLGLPSAAKPQVMVCRPSVIPLAVYESCNVPPILTSVVAVVVGLEIVKVFVVPSKEVNAFAVISSFLVSVLSLSVFSAFTVMVPPLKVAGMVRINLLVVESFV